MYRSKDVDILARTIYGEARGESEIGKRAVASVILNRYKSGKWFAGDTIAETCQFCVKGSKFHQFSCWNETDPNFDLINRISESDKVFCECVDVAEKYIYGIYKDIVCGACHYCASGTCPAWQRAELQICKLASTCFLRGCMKFSKKERGR